MLIFLAVLVFIAGQVYVVYLLYRLDRFLERQANTLLEYYSDL